MTFKLPANRFWGLACCVLGLSLLAAGLREARRPVQFEAVARIKLEQNLNSNMPSASEGDAVQSEMERLQSRELLTEAAKSLDADGHAEGPGAGRMTLEEAVHQIREQLELRKVLGRRAIELRVTAADAKRAAEIANVIAGVFLTNRLTEWQQNFSNSVESTETDWKKDWADVSAKAEELHRKKYQLLEQEWAARAYSNAVEPTLEQKETQRQLDQQTRDLQRLRNQLAQKISSNKLAQLIPKTAPVEIVSHAVPAKRPISPNRSLEVGWFLSGGLLAAAGAALLVFFNPKGTKSAERQR